jgi:hypothetical protein
VMRDNQDLILTGLPVWHESCLLSPSTFAILSESPVS